MSRPNASYTRIFHGSFQFFESSDAPSRLRSSILLIALRWSVRMRRPCAACGGAAQHRGAQSPASAARAKTALPEISALTDRA